MNKYEEYRDSGVEYLGDIPKYWHVSKLKHLTKKIVDGTHFTPKYTTTGIPFLRVTDLLNKKLDMNSIKYISQEEHEELIKRCKPENGDLLVSKNGTIGRTMVVNLDFEFSIFVSLCLIKIKEDKLFVHWLEYIIHSNFFKQQIYRGSKTTSVTNLHLEIINEMIVLTPSLNEQKEIITHLDCKIGIVDELISSKKKQVELLKEKKQAVINNVITQGLNPDVKFKDTNIDYLGKIPTHWNITMLKYIGTAKIGAIYSPADVIDDTGTLVLRSSNIQNGKLSLKNTVYIKQKKTNTTHNLKTNDILICSRNGSRNLIGKNILINESHLPTGTIFGAFMTVFRSKYNEFLYYIFNTYIFKYYSAMFLTSTINQLTIANLYSLTVPLPPIEEQTKIANYLDEKTSMIDNLISQIQKSIELLEEYKTSLISHVVTGKIKVINS